MYLNNTFKVGDKVLLTRAARDYEDGWSNTWHPLMTGLVGQIGEVIGNNQSQGYTIRFPTTHRNFSYPYFVLKLSGKGQIPELCSNFGEFDKIASKYAR